MKQPMIASVRIEVIPHGDHRYKTVGDWVIDNDGRLLISVSDVKDWRAHMLVALHELAEAILCTAHGISDDMVDAFDMSHPELDEPGLEMTAPYRLEHLEAARIEKLIADAIPVDWTYYVHLLDKLDDRHQDE